GIVAPPLHFHSILASHVLARFPVPRVISVGAAQFSRREVVDDGGLCTSRGPDPTERADGQTHNENEECPAEPDMKTSLRNDERLCSATIESIDPLIRQETLRMHSDGRIRGVTEERCECVSHVTNSSIWASIMEQSRNGFRSELFRFPQKTR
ncbi:hypothetical protein ALC57_18191, partial [Trachymyrmex cornetzi]